MQVYDVFNGDADGICALHQLRLAGPEPGAILVTGVKRDIRLLDRLVEVRNATITVLDISLDSNRASLLQILAGNRVRYIDHHFAGEIPTSANLEATILPAPELCTSLIVDNLLAGRHRPWAIVGAFGDNLHAPAQLAAESLSLSGEETTNLREVGELLNYNSYGKTPTDLYFHPLELYNAVKPYRNPLEFHRDSEVLKKLRDGFKDDMERARQTDLFRETAAGRIYLMPDESWSRRVAGVFMNEKARERENQAHALLVDNGDRTLLASIRAPLANRTGADTLCRKFPTGGGRAAAAGVNSLPERMLEEFITAFSETFSA
ncbi:MAG: acetyltransferase [Proteobacteria bacterium]|nr:acetyltransferase [Pseudomonadota bacterium]MBU1739462.1 acetyltransferase [Pseudomonadota bacterium]